MRAIMISLPSIGRNYRHVRSRARNDCSKGQEVVEMIEIAVEEDFCNSNHIQLAQLLLMQL